MGACGRLQRRFLRTPSISLWTSIFGGLLGGAFFLLALWSPKLAGAGNAGCATRLLTLHF